MASLRVFGSAATSITRASLVPRFSINHTQIRTLLTISAFEKAMQEVHGDRWREVLNSKQKNFVQYKEHSREAQKLKWQKEMGDKWEAHAAEESAKQYASTRFQDKLRRLKESLSKEALSMKN